MKQPGINSKNCVCPFKYVEPGLWHALPQRPFKPKGLLLWGDLIEVSLDCAIIGSSFQLAADVGPIPARFFATADSFAQVANMIDKGKEPPAWCNWDTVVPGQLIKLQFSRKSKPLLAHELELVMWGQCLA